MQIKQIVIAVAAAAAATPAAAHGIVRAWTSHDTVATASTVQGGPTAGSADTAMSRATSGGVEITIPQPGTVDGVLSVAVSAGTARTTRTASAWAGVGAVAPGLLVGGVETPAQLVGAPAGEAIATSRMLAVRAGVTAPATIPYDRPILGMLGVRVTPAISLGFTRASRSPSVDGTRTSWGWGWGVGIGPATTQQWTIYARQAPLTVRGGAGVRVSSPVVIGAREWVSESVALGAGWEIPQVSGEPVPLTTRGGAWASATWRPTPAWAVRVSYAAGSRVCTPGGCMSVRGMAPEWPDDPAHPRSSYDRGLRVGVGYSPARRVRVSLIAHYAPAIVSSASTLGVAAVSPSGGALLGPVPVSVRERSWGVGASLRVLF